MERRLCLLLLSTPALHAQALAPRRAGARAIGCGQVQSGCDLYPAEISPAGRVPRPERLTRAPMSDFNPRPVFDPAGNVTVVWQSFRAGNADIYARRLSGKSWGPETRVSSSDSSDWEPSVALDSLGVAWISWDSDDTGNTDVL